jgi:cutinase
MTRIFTRSAIGILIAACGIALFATPAQARPTAHDGPAHRGCASVEVVVVRGTGEPGALGQVVGDPVYTAMRQRLRSVDAYAVRYPATLVEPASIDQGAVDMVGHLIEQARRCPGQRYVVSGYSQGAYVVSAVLGATVFGLSLPTGVPDALIPAWLHSRIAAIMLFGNPISLLGGRIPLPWAARTITFCTPGDPICQPGGRVWPAHMQYLPFIPQAAEFATAHLGAR